MVRNMEEKEETIDLQELFQILKKRLHLIVMIAIIATTISGAYTHFFVTPIYQTSTQMIVSNLYDDNPITHSDIQLSLQLINTFNDILLSPVILDQVIEELNLATTAGGLSGRMSASNSTSSQVIALTVRHENPISAYRIANTTAEIFREEVPEILNVDTVSILATAQLPTSPISPNLTLNMAIGLVIGVMSGIFLVFMLEFLDKTVKTEQEVEKLIGLPVLGMIPTMTEEDFKLKDA